MKDQVTYSSEDGIGVISLQNKNNPLNLNLLQQITKLISHSHEDGDRILILRSLGKNFTVGVDLKYIYNTVVIDKDLQEFAKLSQAFQEITRQIIKHSGIVIVSLNGWVVGGGFEISLAADLRIASETTRIMLPELSIGTMFSNACTKLLPDLIGLSRAKYLMILGEEISVSTALEYGLINEVYQDEELELKTLELAKKLIYKTNAKAVSEAKMLIEKNRNLDTEIVLTNEVEILNLLGNNSEFLENIRKFVEK